MLKSIMLWLSLFIFNAFAINNGTVVAENVAPHVVKLIHYNNEVMPQNCTGVFLSPRAIITAAHCFYYKVGNEIKFSKTGMYSKPGSSDLKQCQDNCFTHFDEVEIMPGFISYGRTVERDVALIILKQDETRLRPEDFPFIQSEKFSNQEVEFYGFGASHTDSYGAWVKRLGKNILLHDEPREFSAMWGSFEHANAYRNLDIVPSKNISTSNVMDSGMGCFVKNKLVAISSSYTCYDLFEIPNRNREHFTPKGYVCPYVNQVHLSYYADVTSKNVQTFLKDMDQKYQLNLKWDL